VSSIGSNQHPDPDTSHNFIIDTVPPTITVYQPSTPTVLTNSLVNGKTESEIFVDIYNYNSSNGNILWSSNKNILSDLSGDFSGWISLGTPKESTNWITARARDKAGNISSLYVPRRRVRCINSGGGSGYVIPSTNKKLGSTGDPYLTFIWTADADMNNGSFIIEIPFGWASPSLTPGNAGYVYIKDTSGIILTGSPTNLQIKNKKIKICFSFASVGGYIELVYGTNNMTMVSNNAVVGLNTFALTAISDDPGFRTNWNLPRIVYPPPGETLDIFVTGESLKMYYTSAMPSTVYRGQSMVSVITLFFTNSNISSDIELEKLVFTTENSNNIGIIPRSAISKIALYTNRALFFQDSSIETSGDMIVADFSFSSLIIAAQKMRSVIVKVNIANDVTAKSLKLNLKSSSDVAAKDVNSGTLVEVQGTAGDDFPMRSGYCTILSNKPADRMLTSYISTISKTCDAGEMNFLAMQLVFRNTNSSVNEIHLTGLTINIEDANNGGIIPDTVVNKVIIQDTGGGIIHLQDNTIESSGNSIYLDLFAASIYISPVSSITLDIKLDIKANTSVTNFHLSIINETNIKAQDEIYLSDITNYAAPGYSFPMRGDSIDIVKYFLIIHDGYAPVSQWEPIRIHACNANGSIVPGYTGTISLDTDGTVTTIHWTNNYSSAGSFLDAGIFSDRAQYQFAAGDGGVITLSIKNSTAESINIDANDQWVRDSDTEGYLIFQGQMPDISILKLVQPKKARPFEILTYMIKYTNKSIGPAYDFIITESLPTNVLYIIDSAEVSNSLHAGTVSIFYSTNYGFNNWLNNAYDASNTIMYIKKIRWVFSNPVGAAQKGMTQFKVLIK